MQVLDRIKTAASNAASTTARWANAKTATVIALGTASASSANAAVDVSAVVTEIQGAAAPVALIGAAVLLIFVGVKAFKWVRGALS